MGTLILAVWGRKHKTRFIIKEYAVAEANEVAVSPSEEDLAKVQAEIAEVIDSKCEGCSTAKFAPHRLGMLVLKDKMSLEQAQEWASDCTIGFTTDPIPLCHLGSHLE